MSKKYVVVENYNPEWKNEFIKIRNEIADALGTLAISIEHVGSTSVEGLAAKPVIDIDVITENTAVLNDVISALSGIGYTHEGDLGVKGREAFKYTGKDHLMKHHLYVCSKDSEELNRHLKFRDYLRAHPEAVEEYGNIKKKAAELYPEDIDSYIEYKSPVILRIYKTIGLE